MIEGNRAIPEEKRLVFRIGINIGDIIIDGNDIFGDGVNIAARLESICEPGGLCISDIARDQVRDKLPLAFVDGGEQQVKNIARPVRVFALTPQAIADAPELASGRIVSAMPRSRAILAGLLALVLAIAGAAAWWTVRQVAPSASQTASIPRSSGTDARPTIAVLPLVSFADAKDEYFADGLTEPVPEICTGR
jgi:adenylate cyclase